MRLNELIEGFFDKIDQLSLNPPHGTKLASYTDEDGYTIEIVWGVEAGKEMAMGMKRYGTMFITSPKGKRVQAGYWMNWPEEEWGIVRPIWENMSQADRAKLEVKQQATAYDSLADQFEHYVYVRTNKS